MPAGPGIVTNHTRCRIHNIRLARNSDPDADEWSDVAVGFYNRMSW